MANLWLFIRLTPETFERVRTNYGVARHVGREMPREIPKSWTYISHAWNKFARTPVTSTIENAKGGDEPGSVTFHLYGDGKGSKKNKKASVHLRLPKSLDNDMYKVAALVKHFTLHATNRDELYGSVNHEPEKPEVVHILRLLQDVVDGLPTKGLFVHEIYRDHVKTNPAFAAYTGPEWENWFTKKLERRLLLGVEPRNDPTPGSPQTAGKVISGANMIRFLQDLSTLVGTSTESSALLKQWISTLETCSSHWCPPPFWWCLATLLVGSNLDGMTRSLDGDVPVAATCLENWDMFPLLKLLQSNIFPKEVIQAAWQVQIYTRTDMAHERFDCNWRRDWICLADLLDSLGCSSEADGLRKHCEPKFHTDDGGERVSLMTFVWRDFACA